MKSNASGLVGMSNSVHAELKRAAMYNTVLKSPQEFAKDIRAQYQTSLGLGSPFPKDRLHGESGRGKRSSSRSFYRDRRFRSGRSHQLSTGFSGSDRQGFQSSDGTTRGGVRDAPLRNTAPCYDFQAGNCRRGTTCRFSHNINN